MTSRSFRNLGSLVLASAFLGIAGRLACTKLVSDAETQGRSADRRGARLRAIVEACVRRHDSRKGVEQAFEGEARPSQFLQGKDWGIFVLEDVVTTHVDGFPPEDLRWRIKVVLDRAGRAVRCVLEEKVSSL